MAHYITSCFNESLFEAHSENSFTGPACSDETEPIASLSRHFNMLTVSYGAEASSLSNRVNYPFFFRTIPEVSHHK